LLLDLRSGIEAAHGQAEEQDVLRHLYRLPNEETEG